jgi:phosphatidylglycerophosphate synthase
MSDASNRRPLKSRGAAWAQRLAESLAGAQVSPDVISALSLAFASLGAVALLWSGLSSGAGRVILLTVAALAIQLRLLCNLMDGLVAVEHGRGSAAGPIWNELPDRFADALFLVAAGYGAQAAGLRDASALGWFAAVLAVICAYVRELGRALGFAADFSGPMAKPHRMAALTVAALVSVVEPAWGWRGESLAIGLAVIALGTVLTIGRRTLRLARRLSALKGDAED